MKAALYDKKLGLDFRKKLIECCIRNIVFVAMEIGHFGK